ncbi:CYTH and CHAD domain-containing protein [Accumulibacter sp.]|uniref:CYTH and CHAD domain-containing protein n=1 Tax=Accumulibacter sp. TaxID=2053492 RepID=UPI002613CE1B|nr:CYTH and CHAD domain-containing protein [Accumulibacter sp.]
MATETEIKLSLPARATSQLARHPLLAGVESHRQLLVNTYYDTPTSRLRSERIVLRHRRKGRAWLLTVKTAAILSGGLAQRSEWEAAGQLGEFDFSHVDDAAVRSLLESLRGELQPIFTTRFTRQTWLFEPGDGLRVEVALDRGWIQAEGRRRMIREIELELLSGTLSDLFRLASDLQSTLALHPEASSKSDRAYRLLANAPLGAVKASLVPVEGSMSTIAAFRLIALSCLNHLQSNEEGVCNTELPEFVHQARVAIRRLRSAMRLWEPLLPETFVARFDPLWQSLASKLGDARNWDVFIAETLPALSEAFPHSAPIERLALRSQRWRASSRAAARRALRAPDYSRLLIEFTAAVLGLPDARAGRLDGFVPRCLGKRLRRVNERSPDALGADVAARHRLRVAFKQLRYALEFFTPILAGPALLSYHQAATSLQEVLGRLNDLAVAQQSTSSALPGRQGEAIQRWLGAEVEARLPELASLLDVFERQSLPWKTL